MVPESVLIEFVQNQKVWKTKNTLNLRDSLKQTEIHQIFVLFVSYNLSCSLNFARDFVHADLE